MARKKEHLIPLEKSKRIIYLYDKGPEKKKRFGVISTAVLSVLCLIYCLAIAFLMGYGTKFFLIWGVLSAVSAFFSFLFSRPEMLARIPKWIRYSVRAAAVTVLILFVGTEAVILSKFGSKGSAGADYVIVLGAQWKERGPSYVLQKRLDAAVDYLQKNPGTKVIVSGGKGGNEPISEAEGMYRYLTEKGIQPERILREDKSRNTYENLKNSAELLDIGEDRVVIVTNKFHVFRAVGIAKKMRYANAEGLGAGSYPAMLPNNLLREFFGVWKDFLAGNL